MNTMYLHTHVPDKLQHTNGPRPLEASRSNWGSSDIVSIDVPHHSRCLLPAEAHQNSLELALPSSIVPYKKGRNARKNRMNRTEGMKKEEGRMV